ATDDLTGVLDGLSEFRPASSPSAKEKREILRSKADLNRLSGLLDGMRGEEDRLLAQRQEAAESANSRTTLVVAVAGGAGLIRGLLAVVLFTSGVVKRMRGLHANALLLAEGRPLPATPPGKDEIGRRGSALETAGDLLR